MTQPPNEDAIARLFTEARTHSAWRSEPVDTAVLRRLYTLASMGPTSINCQPMRLQFVIAPEDKQRLLPALSAGNVDKVTQAPVTVIVAYDRQFYDQLPGIWHRPDAREKFARDPALAASTALRNSSMQGAYLILAARSLGLDCGPMSGFDADKVDAEFFSDGAWTANFLCNLGYGDPMQLKARQRRLDVSEACRGI